MPKQFAEELKAAREKVGISLQQIAAKTRIDIKFLKALENGDFNFLPELYVKAFIKQYCKVIGLDEQEILYKFNLTIVGKTGEEKEEKSGHSATSEEAKGINESVMPKQTKKSPISFTDDSANKRQNTESQKKQNPLLIGGGALAAILVLILGYFLFFNKSNDIIVEEKPFEEVLKETPKRYIDEKNNLPAQNLVSNLDKLTLTFTDIDSTDSAWVLVIIDDTTQTDFMLLPKISRLVTATNNFKFTLGNSGATEISFDSKPLAFDKRRGAVRHFKFDKNGLERLYSPPQLNQ
jgi:cytoskeletal protein RodZ